MSRSPRLRFAALVALGCLGAAPARASSLIDFEKTPSGVTPTDNHQLVNPYAIDGGGTVRFFFDKNGNNTYDEGVDALPIFEEVAKNSPDGFLATTAGPGKYDQVRAGSGLEGQLGDFFLRQPQGIGKLPGPFVIAYTTTQDIRGFSGEIWDIDAGDNGYERWQVDALNASGSVISTLLSPKGLKPNNPASLDSMPWAFGFTNLGQSVASIRLTFVGTKADDIGLAFNNFSPTFAVPGSVVPEPSSLALLGSAAALGLAAAARRRRRDG